MKGFAAARRRRRGGDVALRSIELFAGVGMLGEGFAAACRHLGVEHRPVAYVEREASAAGQLVALMEAGAIHEAPVWSDVATFDGLPWRGAVDCIAGGFPCQDISVAGKRAGLDGGRSGLFFRILDIADDCGAWILALENVSAITTAAATVVDEAEGVLIERAAARVVGELADRGWDAEWMHVSASDAGASHGRERWFCLAWRRGMDDASSAERREGGFSRVGACEGRDCERQEAGPAGIAVETLADAIDGGAGQRLHARRRDKGPGARSPGGASDELADASCSGQQAAGKLRQGRRESDLSAAGEGLAHAERGGDRPQAAPADHGRDQEAQRSANQHGGCGGACLPPVADAGEPGLPQPERADAGAAGGGG